MKLKNCLKVSAATLTAAQLTTTASAAIVAYSNLNIPVTQVGTGSKTLSFRFSDGATTTTTATTVALGYDYGLSITDSGSSIFLQLRLKDNTRSWAFDTDNLPVDLLVAGTLINNALTYETNSSGRFASSSNFSGDWTAGGRGFIGIKFADGFSTHYGWADVTTNSLTQMTLHGFAFDNTPSTGITAGTIPEPKTAAALMGALVLGAIGVRKLKSAQSKK